ncbi:MAG: efflux RND transporter periplasmic adaptor subunit [Planctomycetaceae bacterium]|nr:efflux RND transporter periplasmic adaptor subunit [Planctomycetaceae bacterium]
MILLRSGFKVSLIVAALLAVETIAHGGEVLRIDSVVLELIEQSDVPARDPGVIEAISVKEGDLVKKGDTLVKLDTAEAELDVAHARLEWDIARQEAKNDVDVRFARKSLEVAEAELQRALDSVENYPKSVSATELDRLKLTVERTGLEIEQAQHVLNVAEMTAALKGTAFEAAEQKLDRQTIRAPIDGVVVQVYRHNGEWVEPGQQVVRILRMDRLRAVGFVAAAQLDAAPLGSAVELLVKPGEKAARTFSGTLVYVSPEVDPVNDQVRVWAEVDNPEMQLKPGMRGAMIVRPGGEESKEHSAGQAEAHDMPAR